MKPANLNELVAGCRAGDRKAQEYVFNTYHSDFLKTCLRYAPDRPTADSMLNEAFFRIFTRIDQYRETGAFAGWMHAILINTCLEQLRKETARPEMQPAFGENEQADPELYVNNEALSRMGLHELVALIQRLPATTRAVFNLFVFEGYAHREIARELGMSEGTSHWHVSTARSWLKSQILKEQQHGRQPVR